VPADQGTATGPAELVARTREAFGDQIDIIINNAAAAVLLSLEDSTIEEFDKHYHLNVRGPMLLVQAALPYLPKDDSGRIINISSVSSTIGFPMQSEFISFLHLLLGGLDGGRWCSQLID
jgi:3-oxoacyl-[acyl-carrier protein] reductase